jgi:hypothetical protein
MKRTLMILVGCAVAATSGAAFADPGKDESGKWRERGAYSYGQGNGYGYGRQFYERGFPARGHGYREERRERRAFKQEFWDGNCKVERKWDGDEYKEERKCKRGRAPAYGYYRY